MTKGTKIKQINNLHIYRTSVPAHDGLSLAYMVYSPSGVAMETFETLEAAVIWCNRTTDYVGFAGQVQRAAEHMTRDMRKVFPLD